MDLADDIDDGRDCAAELKLMVSIMCLYWAGHGAASLSLGAVKAVLEMF